MRANLPIMLWLAAGCAGSPATPAAPAEPGRVSRSSPVGRRLDPPALHAPSGYSHVVESRSRRIVHIAGQLGLDRTGQLPGDGDFRAQTEQVFTNLGEALRAVGANFGHIVKLTIFVTALIPDNLATLREVRERYIDPARAPASSMVEVSRLIRPELVIEIEAVAVIPE